MVGKFSTPEPNEEGHNESIYYNVDCLEDAIEQNKKLRIRYVFSRFLPTTGVYDTPRRENGLFIPCGSPNFLFYG